MVSLQGWNRGQTASPLSLFLCSFLPLASLTVCFSPKGKLKPVWFVFLLLLAVRLLLKPRCWWAWSRLSQKHEVDRRFIGEEWMCEEAVTAVFQYISVSNRQCFLLSNRSDSLSASRQTVDNTFFLAELIWTQWHCFVAFLWLQFLLCKG